MLQSLRDNLKGTIAVIIVAIFAVPMVLFGVERLFVGSLGGNDVASVDGISISRAELNRAIYLQKQRILSQSDIDPSSDFLKDENLRGPVLQSLIREAALVNAAQEGGMAISEAALWQQIAQQPQFQSDGTFDQQQFRQLVNNMGYTTATYLEALREGLIADQQSDGIAMAGFVTDQELARFVAMAQQSRDYFSITVPRSAVEGNVTVTDEEIAQYYDSNQQRYRVPEQVALNYIEINLDTLAKRQQVDEADIKAQFEQELASFDADPRFEVSHILIEGEQSTAKVEQVQSALDSGKTFAEVAREYSDDLGTKESGGYLGVLVEDAFPETFVSAVQNLNEGEVSEPVQTEAGVHIIRVDDKTVPEAPSYEERKPELEQQLRRVLAQQEMARMRERLDELTFSAADLQQAAAELDLEIKTSELAPRNTRSGLLGQTAVKEAAFSADVLEEGHNSRVLELPGDRLVVVRVEEHQAERTRPLAEVRDAVEQQLRSAKIAEATSNVAAQLKTELEQGAAPQDLAQARGFAYAEGQQVSRSDADLDRSIRQRLFSLPRPVVAGRPVIETVPTGEDQVILGLTAVHEGTLESLSTEERQAMSAQLARQFGGADALAYEAGVMNSAEVETN